MGGNRRTRRKEGGKKGWYWNYDESLKRLTARWYCPRHAKKFRTPVSD
jgi:hypothetical protein